jgi:ubiquinone/menaquinone biosynthesis C-methylase UbiE
MSRCSTFRRNARANALSADCADLPPAHQGVLDAAATKLTIRAELMSWAQSVAAVDGVREVPRMATALPAVYGSRAELYDRIYSFKDYAAESRWLVDRLMELGVTRGARLLDAACGTGAHLTHLRDHFQVEGFDASAEMLTCAEAKLPNVRLFQADLTSFTVDEPFDAVVCLFSSIGYLTTRAQLDAAARCFAAALRPGGVALVEPWFTPEQWNPGKPALHVYESDDLKLARACVAEREGDLAIMEMHWLVAARARPVESFVERHATWLCPHDTLVAAFDAAGFETELDPASGPTGRGMITAKRR